MPEKTIAKFEISYLQILDEKGKVDTKLEKTCGLSKKQLLEMYRYMVFTRVADDKSIKLQRQGRMGTYAPCLGQEATQIGSAYAMKKEDWMFPTYRDTGQYLVRGMPLRNLLMYWMGDERGMAIPQGQNNFPLNIVVGSLVPHATGAAYALKLQKKNAAAVVYFGDGATSEGECYEGMNWAGVLNAPVLFICENNQYAISLPRKWQSVAKTLAQKGIAAGIHCIQVDGNDVLAVYLAAKLSLQRARAGKGPTFIECYTYRMEMHTTADDPTRYRSKAEVMGWKKKDPVDRFRKYLEKKKLWNQKKEAALLKECAAIVEKEVAAAEKLPPPPVEDMFKYVYETPTPELHEQLDYLKSFVGRKENK